MLELTDCGNTPEALVGAPTRKAGKPEYLQILSDAERNGWKVSCTTIEIGVLDHHHPEVMPSLSNPTLRYVPHTKWKDALSKAAAIAINCWTAIFLAQSNRSWPQNRLLATHGLANISVTQFLIQFTAHIILTPTYQLFTPFSGLIYCILLFYPFPISTYNLARLTPLPAPPGHLSPVTENIYIHEIAKNVLRTLCNNGFSPPFELVKPTLKQNSYAIRTKGSTAIFIPCNVLHKGLAIQSFPIVASPNKTEKLH